MERQAEQYIQSLSDADLLEYTRTSTHLPEALEFARIELSGRHLPADRLASLEEELKQRQEARAAEAEARAREPLAWEWRIALFLCGLYFVLPLLCAVPTWLRFRNEGAHQKYKEMWISAVVGFCLQPILICLRIPPWGWLVSLF